MMYNACLPTLDVHASHAESPGLPSGAPSIETPVATPVRGGAMLAAGNGSARTTPTRSSGAAQPIRVPTAIRAAAQRPSRRVGMCRRWGWVTTAVQIDAHLVILSEAKELHRPDRGRFKDDADSSLR